MLGAEVTVENLTGAFDSVKSGVYWQRLEREFHRELLSIRPSRLVLLGHLVL
jgi:hypothetical protein